MPYRKRGGQGQKSARRLEISAVLVEFSKRLADFQASPMATSNPHGRFSKRQKKQENTRDANAAAHRNRLPTARKKKKTRFFLFYTWKYKGQ